MNRNDFEILNKYIYLDHAAGALKPNQVIAAGSDFYKHYAINPHSVDSLLGYQLYKKIIDVRKAVADFNNVKPQEVFFTAGATDGLNQIAEMFNNKLKEGDEILLQYLNHSSNAIVWLELAKRTKAKVVWANNVSEGITSKTKIIAISEINNTIDQKIDIQELYNKVHHEGIYLINDAAQAVAHKLVDGKSADFTVWSANKLYGPTGTGVMIIKKYIQKKFPLVRFGGGANSDYDETNWTPSEYSAREPGTPNTAGIIMLGAAIDYVNKIGLKKIYEHEKAVALYGYDQLAKLKNIEFASQRGDVNILFNIKGHNSQDIVSYLGHRGIILRSGKHCVGTIKKVTGKYSWIRATIGLYNERTDFDKLCEEIKNGGDFLDFI